MNKSVSSVDDYPSLPIIKQAKSDPTDYEPNGHTHKALRGQRNINQKVVDYSSGAFASQISIASVTHTGNNITHDFL